MSEARERLAVRAALVAIALLGVLAVVRAFALELDPYDGYEVRSSARAIAGDRAAPFAIYRSPLLVLAEVPFEKWARATRATWVAPHLLTALAYVALALGARRLAAAAGASKLSSAAAGLAVALDRLAFADAPLGLPDGLAAALATWGLALAFEERSVAAALLLGLGAAARPNDGLACLGVLVLALEGGAKRRRGLLACGGAAAVFFAVTAAFFALAGHGALAGFAELRDFQRLQLAENFEKYGRDHPRFLVYLRALFAMEPGTALLAPVALALARGRRAFALVAVAIAHVVFLTTLVGHAEARYLLPALPPLAALGALAVDRVANVRARGALAAAWVGLPLVLAAPSELARARDPVLACNPSLEIARAVAAVSTNGRVFFAPDLPFPVYPRLLANGGTPFPGDPFHGIGHLGHVTIAYHLERPVSLKLVRDQRGLMPLDFEWVGAVANDPSFRDGDVLVARSGPHTSWLLPDEPPEIRIYEVRPVLRLVWARRFRQ